VKGGKEVTVSSCFSTLSLLRWVDSNSLLPYPSLPIQWPMFLIQLSRIWPYEQSPAQLLPPPPIWSREYGIV